MTLTKPGRPVAIVVVGALALCALAAGAFVLTSLHVSAPLQAEAAAPAAPASMNVAALGRIEPQGQVINVASGTPDRLESLLVQRGDPVKQGQIIGYLQSHATEVAQRNQLAAQLAAAKLKLSTETELGRVKIENAAIKLKTVNDVYPLRIATQEATIAAQEVALKNNREILKAYSQLLTSNSSSQRVYDNQFALVEQGKANLIGAKSRLDELKQQFDADRADGESQVALARATLARSEAELAIEPLVAQIALQDERVRRATIYAPIDGRILNTFARPGELVGTAPVVAMGDTGKMRAVAEVYETDIGRVKVGQRARITSRTLTTPVTGRVVEIGWMVFKNDVLNVDPAARADARVVEVRIELDDAAVTQRLTTHTVDILIDTTTPNPQVSSAAPSK
jgi:HlyD family secretion protein